MRRSPAAGSAPSSRRRSALLSGAAARPERGGIARRSPRAEKPSQALEPLDGGLAGERPVAVGRTERPSDAGPLRPGPPPPPPRPASGRRKAAPRAARGGRGAGRCRPEPPGSPRASGRAPASRPPSRGRGCGGVPGGARGPGGAPSPGAGGARARGRSGRSPRSRSDRGPNAGRARARSRSAVSRGGARGGRGGETRGNYINIDIVGPWNGGDRDGDPSPFGDKKRGPAGPRETVREVVSA